MTSGRLPDAVPPDNSARARFAGGDEAYRAPEMAVPLFAGRRTAAPDMAQLGTAQRAAATPFEDDDAGYSGPSSVPGPARLWSYAVGAIILVLGLAAFFIAITGNNLPLCSSQPDWNQYNCRMG